MLILQPFREPSHAYDMPQSEGLMVLEMKVETRARGRYRPPPDRLARMTRLVLAGLISVLLPGLAGSVWAQTANEAARLVETLELRSGMTVADIGAGRGEMTVELAKRLGPGRVYATEIDERWLAELRDTAARGRLTNVTIVEGGERTTNLPDSCCDAIFMRDVYHHLTHPEEIGRSLFKALKPGGRLAVIDFLPHPGSKLPDGVRANRGGHGISAEQIADEMTAVGLTRASTVAEWLVIPSMNRPIYLVLFRKPY